MFGCECERNVYAVGRVYSTGESAVDVVMNGCGVLRRTWSRREGYCEMKWDG